MVTGKLNERLLEAMERKVPDRTRLTSLLMDELEICREDVEERFSGDTCFTLEEAAALSRRLGLSLDKILDIRAGDGPSLDINIHGLEDPLKAYDTTLQTYLDMAKTVGEGCMHEFWDTLCRLPFYYLRGFNLLSKFHLFKWLYRRNAISEKNTQCAFDNFVYTSKIYKQLDGLHGIDTINESNFIWDRSILSSTISDISYFHDTGMISNKSLAGLRDELWALTAMMEKAALTGKWPWGGDIRIYISGISFHNSYGYFRTNEKNVGIIRLYDINAITSVEEKVCTSIKNWIGSILKFSTLISRSAEKERYEFFKTQRENIGMLLKEI